MSQIMILIFLLLLASLTLPGLCFNSTIALKSEKHPQFRAIPTLEIASSPEITVPDPFTLLCYLSAFANTTTPPGQYIVQMHYQLPALYITERAFASFAIDSATDEFIRQPDPVSIESINILDVTYSGPLNVIAVRIQPLDREAAARYRCSVSLPGAEDDPQYSSRLILKQFPIYATLSLELETEVFLAGQLSYFFNCLVQSFTTGSVQPAINYTVSYLVNGTEIGEYFGSYPPLTRAEWRNLAYLPDLNIYPSPGSAWPQFYSVIRRSSSNTGLGVYTCVLDLDISEDTASGNQIRFTSDSLDTAWHVNRSPKDPVIPVAYIHLTSTNTSTQYELECLTNFATKSIMRWDVNFLLNDTILLGRYHEDFFANPTKYWETITLVPGVNVYSNQADFKTAVIVEPKDIETFFGTITCYVTCDVPAQVWGDQAKARYDSDPIVLGSGPAADKDEVPTGRSHAQTALASGLIGLVLLTASLSSYYPL